MDPLAFVAETKLYVRKYKADFVFSGVRPSVLEGMIFLNFV